MSYENDEFLRAANDAGMKGYVAKRNHSTKASDDFSEYLHNQYPDRAKLGYSGILPIAKNWWSDNRNKYE